MTGVNIRPVEVTYIRMLDEAMKKKHAPPPPQELKPLVQTKDSPPDRDGVLALFRSAAATRPKEQVK
jgi:hypothetical protein